MLAVGGGSFQVHAWLTNSLWVRRGAPSSWLSWGHRRHFTPPSSVSVCNEDGTTMCWDPAQIFSFLSMHPVAAALQPFCGWRGRLQLCPVFLSLLALLPSVLRAACWLPCTLAPGTPQASGTNADSQQGTRVSRPCSFHFLFCLSHRKSSFTPELPCFYFSSWQYLLAFEDLAQAIPSLRSLPQLVG